MNPSGRRSGIQYLHEFFNNPLVQPMLFVTFSNSTGCTVLKTIGQSTKICVNDWEKMIKRVSLLISNVIHFLGDSFLLVERSRASLEFWCKL